MEEGKRYRGVESYRYSDREWFFGRESEARTLLRLIMIYRGALLFAEPGAGKSSLIQARLANNLVESGFQPLIARVQPRSGHELVIQRIPIDDAETVYLPVHQPMGDPAAASWCVSATELVEYCRGPKECSEQPTPVFIFDQFEEIVTLFETTADERVHSAQTAIINCLKILLNEPLVPVKLLFAFRDDYLGRLDCIFRVAPGLRDQYLRLGCLEPEGLRQAVAASRDAPPVEDNGKSTPFGEKVVEEIVGAVDREGGLNGGRVGLTDVQITCEVLWSQNGRKEFLVLRGIRGLVEDYMRKSLEALGSKRKEAIWLLSKLVTKSDTRNIVALSTIEDDWKEHHWTSSTVLEQLVPLLEKTKVIRVDVRDKTKYLELASEYFIPWISVQRRFLKDQRRFLEEKRRKMHLLARWSVLAFLVLAITAVALGLSFYWHAAAVSTALAEDKVSSEAAKTRAELKAAQAVIIAEQEKAKAAAAEEKAKMTKVSSEIEIQNAMEQLKNAQKENGRSKRAEREINDAAEALLKELVRSKNEAGQRMAQVEKELNGCQNELVRSKNEAAKWEIFQNAINDYSQQVSQQLNDLK